MYDIVYDKYHIDGIFTNFKCVFGGYLGVLYGSSPVENVQDSLGLIRGVEILDFFDNLFEENDEDRISEIAKSFFAFSNQK